MHNKRSLRVRNRYKFWRRLTQRRGSGSKGNRRGTLVQARLALRIGFARKERGNGEVDDREKTYRVERRENEFSRKLLW